MDIRLARAEELDLLLLIYAHARAFMKANGNPTQWGDHYPPRELTEQDLSDGQLYVVTAGTQLAGVFCFFEGVEPNYRHIDGAWLNGAPYGVLHRVASAPNQRGVARCILNHCTQRCAHLRIDTHMDNTPMQHVLESMHFEACGTVQMEDGTMRLAYERPKRLSDALSVRSVTLKNRIGIAPMVCFAFSSDDGMVSDKHVQHYRALAEGGAGLVIQEATCVSPDGRLDTSQIGIWRDEHIPGLRRITQAVHDAGGIIFAQIHHAGGKSVGAHPLAPSSYPFARSQPCTPMTPGDIAQIQQAFIDGALRACEAGYDGVELHGCHSYLISQFLNERVNRRDDVYGAQPDLFVLEILDALRPLVPENFVIGIRLGAFEPTLADGLRHAIALDQHGIDYLSVSYGMTGAADLYCPPGEPVKDVIWAAGQIKAQVQVPVFAVNGIRTPAHGQTVLSRTNVDMVLIGRSALADCAWPRKALAEQEGLSDQGGLPDQDGLSSQGGLPSQDSFSDQAINPCLTCHPCKSFTNLALCPARKRREAGAYEEDDR